MVQTANTTRISCHDPETCSIAVSRLLYPATLAPWRANSVIVTADDHFQTVVPIVSLIHFPFNAPLLITSKPLLSKEILDEILRVQPAGTNDVPQVILAGKIHDHCIRELHRMGFSTLHFGHSDPIVQAVHVAEWRQRYLPDMMPDMVTDQTFVVSLETPQEFLPVLGFSAHMGTPILYVNQDSIPEFTKDFLTHEPDRNVMIIGSERTISKQVETELGRIVFGKVERIGGGLTPEELAVHFTKHKSNQTGMGWGRNVPGKGDALSFMPADWKYAMLSAPLSHLGKHTPLLPLPQGNELPAAYIAYMEYLRPRGKHPEPPYMHAFMIGDKSKLPHAIQLRIEKHISFEEAPGPMQHEEMPEPSPHHT